MIVGVYEAMQDALRRIENFGYFVMSGHDGEYIELVWIRKEDPPEISQLLNVLEADQKTLKNVLKDRAILLPLWVVMGRPWERPLEHWKKIQKAFSNCHKGLKAKKYAYAAACIQFYNNKEDLSWKVITCEESWPLTI